MEELLPAPSTTSGPCESDTAPACHCTVFKLTICLVHWVIVNTVYSVQCTVHCTQFLQCTVPSALYTVHSMYWSPLRNAASQLLAALGLPLPESALLTVYTARADKTHSSQSCVSCALLAVSWTMGYVCEGHCVSCPCVAVSGVTVRCVHTVYTALH